MGPGYVSCTLLFLTVAVQTERTVTFQDTCKWVLCTLQTSMYQGGIYHPLVLLYRTGAFCFEHCLTCSTLKCTLNADFFPVEV